MATTVGIAGTPGVQFNDTGTGSFYTNIITNFFKPVLSDARNNATPLWSAMKKGMATMDTSGRYIIWPVRTGRNRGRNAVREGGEIPDPGAQQFRTYSMESRTYMARIKIDGPTFDRGMTNGGAFAEAQTIEMEGQIDDIMVDHGRMIHNDGSGRLAEYASSATSVMTLRINQSIPAATTCTTKPVLYLEVGDRVGFYNPATDLLRVASGGTATAGQTGFYVQTIASNTTITLASDSALATTVTISDIASLTAGDWVVRVSNEQGANIKSSSARAEMIGIGGIISADGVLDGNGTSSAYQQGSTALTGSTITGGPFQGITASATNPWNQSPVLTSGSGTRPLTEELMQQGVSDFEELNNGELSLFVSSYSSYNAFFAALRVDKRYNNTLTLEGGHTVMTFNGVGFLKDRFAYGNRVHGLGMNQFMFHEVAPLGPMTPNGIPRWERLNDTEAYWTGMKARGNIGVDVRQRAGYALCDLNQ